MKICLNVFFFFFFCLALNLVCQSLWIASTRCCFALVSQLWQDPTSCSWPVAIKAKTLVAIATNGLSHQSDKSVSRQVRRLKPYLPQWITVFLQECILKHYMFWQAMMGDDGLLVCVSFMLHDVLSQVMMGNARCKKVCMWPRVCFVSVWQTVVLYVCLYTWVHAHMLGNCSSNRCLVLHPADLFGGWWIKDSQREGGTRSVKALLASLSSGRHREWLVDPLLRLVRQRDPSSWLKCLMTADNWLSVVPTSCIQIQLDKMLSKNKCKLLLN